ncbi:MAG: cell division protein FtsZ [Candidatus Hodarchaeota archaeon]
MDTFNFEPVRKQGIELVSQDRYDAYVVDEDLRRLTNEISTRILVMGCGGGGNNAVSRLMNEGIQGAVTVAINTDAQQLYVTKAHKKVLIGKMLTRGRGAGDQPQLGRDAAEEDEDSLKEVLEGSDMVFVTCGLGGGTGSGAAPVIAELAKETGALTVSVCTLPFRVEGPTRNKNAFEGLKGLQDNSDTVIVVPNEKLLEVAPDLGLAEAFRVADEILIRSVKGITELMNIPQLMNLDLADVKKVLEDGSFALIGLGESDSNNGRVQEAVMDALDHPLLDSVDIHCAKRALVEVSGGVDLTLREAKEAVQLVRERISADPELEIIWGCSISPDLNDVIRVIILLNDVWSPYILGPEENNLTVNIKNLGLETFE